MTSSVRSLLLAAVLPMILAACSVTVGASAVAADDIEAQAAEEFSAQFPVDAVTCPEDLEPEVGATIDCTLESEGRTFVMVATVAEVLDDTVSLGFELTEEL